jgi:IS30 family transposase
LRGFLEMGLGVREIARRLGRHRSTVHREIARNGRVDGGYTPEGASRKAWARKLRGPRILRSTRLRAWVEDRLAMGWSPEQIARRMELEGSEHRLSTESVYRHVWSPEGRRAGLPRRLAQRKRRRGRPRGRTGARVFIPNRVSIHARPPTADLRSELGHWEGDLMLFRGKDALLTLQERRSRLTLARRLHGKDARRTAQSIVAELGPLPPPARRTLTHDNGGEFAKHARVTEQTSIAVYFCDPGCPGQRGSIENTNGRLRRALPRGLDLAHTPDADIRRLVRNLNTTPRKCLGWMTPLEVFNHEIKVALGA